MPLWGVLALSFLSKDTEQANSQQVQWAKWLFFEPYLMVLWQDVRIVQNLDAEGLTASYFNNFFFLFGFWFCFVFVLPPPVLWVLADRRQKAMQCRNAPLCSFFCRHVLVLQWVSELALSKSGYSMACWVLLSTTQNVPWVSWNAKYAFWRLQEDCVNTAGFMI